MNSKRLIQGQTDRKNSRFFLCLHMDLKKPWNFFRPQIIWSVPLAAWNKTMAFSLKSQHSPKENHSPPISSKQSSISLRMTTLADCALAKGIASLCEIRMGQDRWNKSAWFLVTSRRSIRNSKSRMKVRILDSPRFARWDQNIASLQEAQGLTQFAYALITKTRSFSWMPLVRHTWS